MTILFAYDSVGWQFGLGWAGQFCWSHLGPVHGQLGGGDLFKYGLTRVSGGWCWLLADPLFLLIVKEARLYFRPSL